MDPYYQDDNVTLYHSDCIELADLWTCADVLVTDPPYGRAWRAGSGLRNGEGQGSGTIEHKGIANDSDTTARDAALADWGDGPAIMFGDPLIPQPSGTVQAIVYAKPADAGIRGAHGGFRRDVEMAYLIGPWPVGVGGRTSILRTGGLVAGPRGVGTRAGHPHAKPLDVMEQLIASCPVGAIADPFSGSGSTLVAAKNLGRTAIGVELEERYCEIIAKRCAQEVLDFAI